MAVRIKDGIIPYTWWIGIEITDNHVINVLLREMNNLIHVNEDRELYVDLQLDNWIRPDDDFPVWVTTGKILEEDWWQQNGLILNWKTTSWDYNRLIYANDWNLYIDLWDGVWRLFGGGWWWGWILDCNTKTFYVTKEVVDPDTGTTSIVVDMEQLQDAVDWYFDWKNPILWYQDWMYVFERESSSSQVLYFVSTHLSQVRFESRWTAFTDSDRVVVYVDADTKQITGVHQDVATLSNNPSFIPANYTLRDPFMATQPSHPISLAYLNQQLATKQNILVPWQNITIDPNTNEISAVDTTYTAGTRITIDQNNVISADISGVMTYMWNVTDPSQLPASWNQWDCRYSESNWHLYSWNGTQWNDIGWVTPSMTQFFNKTTDDSDDIHEWNTNLFVSPNEKNTWNAKQDQIIAGNNITINPDWKTINATDTTYSAGTWISIDQNNEISADPYVWWNWITVSGNTITNDAPFEPENIGTMGQYLKKRNDGKYEWANVPQWWSWTSYSAWDWINIDSNNEISNTKPFNPINNGQMGQVLTKSADWYYWKTPQWWGGAEYTAGYGLNLNGNEFSVDTSDIATQSDLSNKQDTISDLSDIRNDAQEWANAYTTIQNYWDIVTHNASEFATSEQWWKADTALQPWDNITELVNNAGYITWISSWDVTGALWYTPYDSSNPSGYITDSYHDSTKQDTLTAWSNIQINNNVISATDTTYNAWTGIEIKNWSDYSAMQWPCPNGFHIPTKDEWDTVWWILENTFWRTGNPAYIAWTYLKLPLAWERQTNGIGGKASDQGVQGYYWSCTPYNNVYSAYIMEFNTNNILYRSYGYLRVWCKSLRWFKDSPVIPDASWTTLYDWSGVAAGAWVFHNATLWLISLSGDWTTWITLADKNIGATTVYNYWDKVSDANCGWYFQWGNNYMFPFYWSVTTSNTQVDASSYWPWNYYYSPIFRDNISPWDSSDNRNLRWGETGVVQTSNAVSNKWVLSVNWQTWAVILYQDRTKTFYLLDYHDLAAAQSAYDWYLAGNYPVIRIWSTGYEFVSGNFISPYLYFYSNNLNFTNYEPSYPTESWTQNQQRIIRLKINSSNAVTEVEDWMFTDFGKWYLAVDVDYNTPYTPPYNWSPATKKYVDDKVISSSTQPSGNIVWQIWFDTSTETLKVYTSNWWKTITMS
jgi:hypothetical protein